MQALLDVNHAWAHAWAQQRVSIIREAAAELNTVAVLNTTHLMYCKHVIALEFMKIDRLAEASEVLEWIVTHAPDRAIAGKIALALVWVRSGSTLVHKHILRVLDIHPDQGENHAAVLCSDLIAQHVRKPYCRCYWTPMSVLSIVSGCPTLLDSRGTLSPRTQAGLQRTLDLINFDECGEWKHMYVAYIYRTAVDFPYPVSIRIMPELFITDDEVSFAPIILSSIGGVMMGCRRDVDKFRDALKIAQTLYDILRAGAGYRALQTVEAAHVLGRIQQKMGIDATKMLSRKLRTCSMPRCALGDAVGSTLWRCSGCSAAHYCCQRHQTAHWLLGHRKECRRTRAEKVMEALAGGLD